MIVAIGKLDCNAVDERPAGAGGEFQINFSLRISDEDDTNSAVAQWGDPQEMKLGDKIFLKVSTQLIIAQK